MIRVNGLCKRFGKKTAFRDVSFEVEQGQVYGLIGFNGAGKTTLLKTIAGVYLPDEGWVELNGVAPSGMRTPQCAPFVVADEPYFLPQSTPLAMARFFRGYYPNWSDSTFTRLLSLFGLEGEKKTASFSKGMQRQVALMLGLSSGAPFLLLDESFDGLDVQKRDVLKRLLRLYAQVNEAAVILSSHNMEELQDVSDRIGMIDSCQLVFDRPVSEFASGELERLFLAAGEVKADDLESIFA